MSPVNFLPSNMVSSAAGRAGAKTAKSKRERREAIMGNVLRCGDDRS